MKLGRVGTGGGEGPILAAPPAFINRLEQGSTILKLIQNLPRLLSWARSFHLLIFSCWGGVHKILVMGPMGRVKGSNLWLAGQDLARLSKF